MCFNWFRKSTPINELPNDPSNKILGSSGFSSSSSGHEPVKSYPPIGRKEKNPSQLPKDEKSNKELQKKSPAEEPPKEQLGDSKQSGSNLDSQNEVVMVTKPHAAYSRKSEDQLHNNIPPHSDKKSNKDPPKESPQPSSPPPPPPPPPPKEQEAAGRGSTRQVLSSNFDEQNEKMLSSTRTTDQPSRKSENQFVQHTVVDVSPRSSDKKSNKEQPLKEHPRRRRVSNLDAKNEEIFTPSSDQPSDSYDDRRLT
ncbi:hypothetical protein BVC80_1815g68 [Macleaya cordata]|uniref:Uncharacterized protein n=1 Tax=Macleaya cordata TaxID=56857 RepID=A0A200QW04_MACCD|nr:hypothetical protein BVC80_1815g68 [Macleaya cordata]